MVELKFGPKTVDLPYTVRIPDVSEALFDELVDEDSRAELIDGVMVVHSPASLRHDDLGGFIRMLMRLHAEAGDHGKVLGPESLVHLRTGQKFAPDIYFVAKKRLPRRRSQREFEGAPDLVIEILSPSNQYEDLNEKRPAYQAARVGEIWLLTQDGELTVDRRKKRGYESTTHDRGRVESLILPGFFLEMDWLQADPLPPLASCLKLAPDQS